MFNKAMSISTIKEFTSKKKNLFIVTNPIQFLNACEAQYSFKTENNILVFLLFKGHNNEENLLKNKNLFPYTQLIILDTRSSRNTISENIALIKTLQQNSYKNVFMGYFSLNMRRYLCNINYEDFFLLDDGTYTITLHNELYNPNYKKSPSMLKSTNIRNQTSKIKCIIYKVYEYYRKSIYRLNDLQNDLRVYDIGFFTIYRLEQYGNEKIVLNNCFFLNKKYNKWKVVSKGNNVYFLGQTLNKVLGMHVEEYQEYIKKIISFYMKKKLHVKYIPHPSESLIYRNMLKKLSSKYFEVLEITVPAEIYIFDLKTKPYVIASFFSSALFKIKALDNSLVIESFLIDYDKSSRSDIDSIYKVLNRSGILSISLEDRR